jgi:hypothetical protein
MRSGEVAIRSLGAKDRREGRPFGGVLGAYTLGGSPLRNNCEALKGACETKTGYARPLLTGQVVDMSSYDVPAA